MRGIYSRFDSKIRFEIESDGQFDSRFDSNAKNDSQVPTTCLNQVIDCGENADDILSECLMRADLISCWLQRP